jgi:ribosomal-protein-alanine N-acetyltransferase
MNPGIGSERLALYAFTPEDCDLPPYPCRDRTVWAYIAGNRATPRSEVQPHLALSPDPGCPSLGDVHHWAILQRQSEEMIGYCRICFLENSSNSASIGGILARACWGMGLATEAARAILGYTFGDARLRRIVALTRSGNYRAHRVLEKIGMRLEQVIRCHETDLDYYTLSRERFHEMEYQWSKQQSSKCGLGCPRDKRRHARSWS